MKTYSVVWILTLLFVTIAVVVADEDTDSLVDDDLENGDDFIALDSEDDDDGSEDDDNVIETKLVEKRSWNYKCSPDECKTRCEKLLNLPDGQCGNAGKCYCRRKSKSR